VSELGTSRQSRIQLEEELQKKVFF